MCRTAEVLLVRLDSVRHTLALMMHRTGIPPVEVAALLGHMVEVHYAPYLPCTQKGARSAATGLGAALARIVGNSRETPRDPRPAERVEVGPDKRKQGRAGEI